MDNKKTTDAMEQVEDSRRDFLKKAAKVAVYTPPAMMIMSQPSYATFQQTGGTTTTVVQTSSFDLGDRRRWIRRSWFSSWYHK